MRDLVLLSFLLPLVACGAPEETDADTDGDTDLDTDPDTDPGPKPRFLEVGTYLPVTVTSSTGECEDQNGSERGWGIGLEGGANTVYWVRGEVALRGEFDEGEGQFRASLAQPVATQCNLEIDARLTAQIEDVDAFDFTWRVTYRYGGTGCDGSHVDFPVPCAVTVSGRAERSDAT